MHLFGNNSSMQPTQLWSVGKSTFLHGCVFINIVFCPCYLFFLWNVVLKCLALCLITIIAAYFLHLYACLTCSSVHASSLHPLLAHHHLCYVDVYCVFFLFLIHATFLCDSILDCLCTYFFVWLFFYTISFWLCSYLICIVLCVNVQLLWFCINFPKRAQKNLLLYSNFLVTHCWIGSCFILFYMCS